MFDIHPTKNYGLTNLKLFETKGNVAVIVNSSANNGVGGYVDLAPTEKGNIVTFSDTTTSESIFYQPNDFIGYSHVQGVYPYDKQWARLSLMYFVAIFRKATFGKFNYGNKFNRKIAREIKILLPTTKNGEIDYEFMRDFIKAIEKLAIKGVVEFADKKIAITQDLINR
ncbi:MAG: restriction endonuclease subunit S [Helicobacteraceae bacterium]